MSKKEEINRRSNNGLFFFKLLIVDKLERVDEKRFKNVKNPLYDDKKGSLSIYLNDKEVWCYKDYGDIKYSGDYFRFCALCFNLDIQTQFSELLSLMIDTLDKNKIPITITPKTNNNIDTQKQKIGVDLSEIDFTREALEVWGKLGVRLETLKLNKVVQLTGYKETYSDGNNGDFKQLYPKIYFAYKMLNSAKLYCPNPKRFLYVGKKPKDYVFGQNFNNDSTLVFLVGGEKDVLTLHSLGYQAICLNSETSLPTKQMLKDYYADQISPIIMYDCDETGRKSAEKISKLTGWSVVDLATIVPRENQIKIKDVSDYISNNLSKQILKDFLNGFSKDLTNEIIKDDSDVEEIEDLEDLEDLEEIQCNDTLIYSPISQKVYDNLPKLLINIIEKINHPHKKDLVLTASLTVLSNLINVGGVYNGKTVFPNLYLFITAPASAGKSVLSWVRRLGHSLNSRFLITYRMEFNEYKENNRQGDKPKRKTVYVSANSSHSALTNQLFVNDGRGIMLETEADTLNNVMKQQWGDLSDVLRRSHEFEPLNSLRVDSEKSFDIEKPRLSIVLTGTKNQLFDLIPSAQNGLFSRFLFFEFPLIKTWENVFEENESLESHYNRISEKVLEYYDETEKRNIHFELTIKQKNRFNEFYKQKQNEFDLLLGQDSIASIRRIGGMQFRIAMLLCTIRSLDNGSLNDNILCEDIDFEISEILARWFINHTKKIYIQLPNRPKHYKELKTIDARYLDKLPHEFSFKEAVVIAESLSIPKGTCENMLRRFKKNQIIVRLAWKKRSN